MSHPSPRPHSTDSQTHKKMTLSMADRSSKTNQIKVISQVGVDPEANRSTHPHPDPIILTLTLILVLVFFTLSY